MTKIFLVLIFFLSTFFLNQVVFAQSKEEEIAKKYGLNFPIAQLGNCNSISACEAFCDKQENQQACTDFAKSKGLHQKQPTTPNDDEILKLAQKELGCNSQQDCMAFCETKANWRRCADFAKRNGLDGGGVAQMEEVMQQLGCDSPKSCMDYCSSPINMPRCMQVFKNAGFEVESAEPIGEWCPKQARGPSETCIVEGENTCVCTDSTSISSEGVSSPKEWCEKDGGEWKDEICWFKDGGVFEPIESWCPKQGSDCKVEGDTCICGGSTSIGSWCPQAGPDCRVEGNDCICGGSNPQYPSEPIESWCPKAGADCRVENNSCICGETPNGSPEEPAADFQNTTPSPVGFY